MTGDLPLAAGICIIDVGSGMIVSVTRKGKADDWAIPGGKVDLGEDVADAASREVLEETGVHIKPWQLRRAEPFVTVCPPGEDGVAYLAHFWLHEVDSMILEEGEIEPGVRTEWRHPSELMSGTMAVYNRELFRHFDLLNDSNGEDRWQDIMTKHLLLRDDQSFFRLLAMHSEDIIAHYERDPLNVTKIEHQAYLLAKCYRKRIYTNGIDWNP